MTIQLLERPFVHKIPTVFRTAVFAETTILGDRDIETHQRSEKDHNACEYGATRSENSHRRAVRREQKPVLRASDVCAPAHLARPAFCICTHRAMTGLISVRSVLGPIGNHCTDALAPPPFALGAASTVPAAPSFSPASGASAAPREVVMPKRAPQSVWTPPDDAVVRALSALRLETPSSPVTDDAAYADTACTLAEEVDHTDSFTYDPLAPASSSIAALPALLAARGFVGDPASRSATLDFLAAEAQSARLATRVAAARESAAAARAAAENPAAAAAAAADTRLASAIARVAAALRAGADDCGAALGTPEDADPAALARLIAALAARAAAAHPAAATAGGPPLVAPADAAAMTPRAMRECSAIAAALRDEHALRKGLLMRRLEVTVQSFGYSEKVGDAGFGAVLRAVQRAVEAQERPVGVYDALVAREALLRVRRVGVGGAPGTVENAVKHVLMGTVPDRGGRVGQAAAAKANMPSFRPRASGGGGGGKSGRGRNKGRRGGRKN